MKTKKGQLMSKIEMLQDQISNCLENGDYFGNCENCKSASKELWTLKGGSTCGANGGVTKKGNACGQWVEGNELCHLHN